MEPYAEPSPPSPASRRPRRWPWVLASLAVVLALVVGGTVTWLVTDRMDDSAQGRDGRPTPAASASEGLSNEAAIQRYDAITELLAARSRAILDRDRETFLALIDPRADAFLRQQANMFDRMGEVPFSSWEYDYSGEGPQLRADRAAQLPAGSWVARVFQRYTFDGSDSPVERQQFLTLVRDGESWALAGDDDGGPEAASARFGRDLWELGPVTVVRGRTSLVIGEAKAADLRGYAREADRSVRDVRGVWKAKWSRRPVVIVPRTQSDMAQVIGTSVKGLEQIAAVTTGYSTSGLTRGDRVVINPRAWRTLHPIGRRVVMTHEVTHLATRAVTFTSVPIWMSEGFADYVAYEAVDIPVRVVAEQVLDRVRDGKVPRLLPGDTDFDATRGQVATAYEGSWLAAQMIAETYGEKKLVGLFVALADHDDEPADEDIRRVLGVSEDELTKDWRAYLKMLARG